MTTVFTQPGRLAFNWLLVTAAVVLTPHLTRLPLWLMLVFIGFSAWRYYHFLQGGQLPSRVLRIALTFLAIAAVYNHYGAILGRDSGIALLTALLGLKFLELRHMRDYMLCIFLFYFLIFGAFLYAQSLWLGLYLFVAVTVCTATQIRLFQPSGLRAAPRFQLSARLVLHALPLMLVLYLLFPRINGTLWGLPDDAYSGLTGLSENLEPGNISELNLSSAIAFRAEFDGPPPPRNELYWRGLVMTVTDGRSWQRQPFHQPGGRRFPSYRRQGRGVHYTITLEPSNRPWMLALDLPLSVPPGSWTRPGYLLEKPSPIRERWRYSLVSYPRYNTGALAPAERRLALQLPDRVDPRVRQLAERWRRQARAPDDVVRSALDYFRSENFIYTLKPPRLGSDPVAEFLFDSRRGYCEHYASALATLMRLAGIPSRIVTGYQGGEFNAAGNYLIVRQSDAHAWVEVWIPKRGWRRADPTAAVAPERVEYGIDALRRLERQGLAFGRLPAEVIRRAIELGWFERKRHQVHQYWDVVNLSWYRWVLDYDKDRQERLFTTLGMSTPSWPVIIAILTLSVIVILLVSVFLLRRWLPRRDRVQNLYLRFCRKLARTGLVRAPHEGALAFAQRSSQERPDLQTGIEAVTRLYLRLRYGKPPKDKALIRDLKYLIAEFKPGWKLASSEDYKPV